MKKFLFLLILIPFLNPALAQNDAKKAVNKAEKAIEKGGKDNKDGDWEDELRKQAKKGGKGSPGAHGRANAQMKQATNPGKGSGKNDSFEGRVRDELGDAFDDDNHKGDKKDGKKKDKKKGGKKK